MNLISKYLIGFFLLIGFQSHAQTIDTTKLQTDSLYYGKTYTQIDTTKVAHREFSNSTLDELQADQDLKYKEPPTVAESLWSRLMMWLSYLIDMILRGATTTGVGRLVMYALGVALLIAIIMMVLKVDAVKVFFSGADKGVTTYQGLHENIHEMNFEKLIEEAIGKNEYRLGTRLIFLFALKILSDKQHIQWIPGKTNHEYVEELKQGDLKTGFNELSFYFDYAWYGNFQVSSELFQKIENTFQQLKSKTN